MQPTMSNEQLIHQYLSGELSQEAEKQLFDAISGSEELRNELSLQLRLQQEAQKDLRTVSVPSATTKAIFTSLGFNAPLSPAVKFSPARFFTPRMSTVLSVAALTIALATFAYMIIDDFGHNDNVAAPSVSLQESLTQQQSNSSNIDNHSSIIEAAEPIASTKSPTPASRVSHSVTGQASHTTEHVRVIPNEPIKAYFDIGKFSSVDYLTQMKIIGVADAGKIYCSEDGGKSWILQDSKTSNDLFGVNFIDTARGVVVGANGTALITPNAGREWEKVTTNTKVNLITVRYATRDTVYACGAEGAILRSTSGGKEWTILDSKTTANLFKIRFTNGSIGTISGERGIALQTRDAGITWEIK
jgi:hypothetical protein